MIDSIDPVAAILSGMGEVNSKSPIKKLLKTRIHYPDAEGEFKLETRKILIISTGHLMQSTVNKYENEESYPLMSKGEFCFSFHVSQDYKNFGDAELDPAVPEDLQEVLIFAAKNGFQEVKFDTDGSEYPELFSLY